MASNTKDYHFGSALLNLVKLLRLEKEEIIAIYWIAAFAGILYLVIPLGIQSIISFVMAGSISTSIILLIVVVVVSLILNGALQIKQLEIIEKIEQKLFVRYALGYAEILPRLDLQRNDEYYMPELVNRFFEISTLQKSIYKLLLEVPGAVLQIILGTCLLSFYHPFFIGFGFFLLVLVFFIIRITSPMGFQTAMKSSDFKYQIGDWLEQISRNIKLFKYVNHHNVHLLKTDSLVAQYLENKTAYFKILRIQYWTLIAFKVLIFAALFLLSILLLLRQEISVGQFIAADIVILGVISSVEKFIQNFDKLYLSVTSLEKLNKITNAHTEHSGNMMYEPATQGVKITFDKVTFAYNPSHKVFDKLSFEVKPSEWVQITGPKHSGKTSLINLVSGAYSEYTGSILLDDIPMYNYDLNSIRMHTGIVLQEDTLMEGTILENIVLTKDRISMPWLLEISKVTKLYEFIQNQRDGFETMVLPYKKNLPSSIVMAILLTRAIYHKPNLLLLEDPFSGYTATEIHRLKDFIVTQFNPTVMIIQNDQQSISIIEKIIDTAL